MRIVPEPENTYLALVPVLDTSRPNFQPAGWRVVEACQRLREIQERLPDLSKEWKGHPIIRAPKSTPSALELSLQNWRWSHMPSARALTLLASEVLHHARIALDYCAYHVVWLDSGKPRDTTKFPLVTDPSRWGKEKRSALPGITPEHADWVRGVQPFLEVGWSATLLQLSNRDKHRMAVEVIPTYRCRVDQGKRSADPLGDPNYWGFAVEDPKLDLNIAPAMSQGAASEPGLPLEKTLVDIMRGVTDLVNRFLTEAGFSAISLSIEEALQSP